MIIQLKEKIDSVSRIGSDLIIGFQNGSSLTLKRGDVSLFKGELNNTIKLEDLKWQDINLAIEI